VADVAVVGTADAQFGEAVVAFVQLKIGARATGDEIVELCRHTIASYKKPKYVFFEDLPRNAQGKTVKTDLRKRATALTQTG
jgi:acyl-coenzyme A synthetase/AMP-(fatty) acid ligase